MPLSEKEKSGFCGIMCFINDSDLISLADTVSHNILNTKNRKGKSGTSTTFKLDASNFVSFPSDAVEAIIRYTNHPFELFKRRKIKKDILFLYSDQAKIDGCLPSDTKKELIRKILLSWNSSYDVEVVLLEH